MCLCCDRAGFSNQLEFERALYSTRCIHCGLQFGIFKGRFFEGVGIAIVKLNGPWCLVRMQEEYFARLMALYVFSQEALKTCCEVYFVKVILRFNFLAGWVGSIVNNSGA